MLQHPPLSKVLSGKGTLGLHFPALFPDAFHRRFHQLPRHFRSYILIHDVRALYTVNAFPVLRESDLGKDPAVLIFAVYAVIQNDKIHFRPSNQVQQRGQVHCPLL